MKDKLIEDIQSIKQALHTMRLTNDITVVGKKSMEMGLDVLIETVKNTPPCTPVSGRSEIINSFFVWFRANVTLYVDKSIEEMIAVYEKESNNK